MHGDRRSRATVRDESGQVIMLAALAMAAMLVMVAFVVDIGKAYLVQRQLQAGVDAAALAGAQHLPDPTDATTTAQDYGPSASEKNEVKLGDNVTTTVTMRCVESAPGCNPTLGNYNAVKVHATSDVGLLFARILGIKKSQGEGDRDRVLAVHGEAARRHARARPDRLDVPDRRRHVRPELHRPQEREGRHADVPRLHGPDARQRRARRLPARTQPERRQLLSEQAVIRAARTTATTRGGRTGSTPPSPSQDRGYYTIVSLSNNYLFKDALGNWVPNGSSWMFQSIGMPGSGNGGCIQGEGTTHYASAVEEAQHELSIARPRKRPGRHRLPLRRRGEHVADEAADRATGGTPSSGETTPAPPASRPRRTRRPGTSRSTRSATTSTPGPPRRRSAGGRTRTATRTGATPSSRVSTPTRRSRRWRAPSAATATILLLQQAEPRKPESRSSRRSPPICSGRRPGSSTTTPRNG